MNQLTVVFPYFENPGMLQKQIDVFNCYPDWVKQNLELIVVDDCSPSKHRAEVHYPNFYTHPQGYHFSLYRILTKVRWGWLQCRNMGAKFAQYPWLMLTDIDHIIPGDTIEYLVKKELEPKKFYTFSRANYPGADSYKPHPNSYFMTKELYWNVGGYDETFAGHYGTDGMWRRRCEELAKGVRLDQVILRVDRKIIADASTTTLDRKENRDPKALDDIREFKEAHGVGVQVLRLPWKKII